MARLTTVVAELPVIVALPFAPILSVSVPLVSKVWLFRRVHGDELSDRRG